MSLTPTEITRRCRSASHAYLVHGCIGFLLAAALSLFSLVERHDPFMLGFILFGSVSSLLACASGISLRGMKSSGPQLGIIAAILMLIYWAGISLIASGLGIFMFVQGFEGSYGPWDAVDNLRAFIVIFIHLVIAFGIWYALIGRYARLLMNKDVRMFYTSQ